MDLRKLLKEHGFEGKDDLGIVALQGTADSGKTTTLNLLLNLMVCEYGEPKEIFDRQGGIVELQRDIAIGDIHDRSWLFEININDVSKRIGITTLGDDPLNIIRKFKKFGKCDLYVCAIHTFGDTVELVKKLTRNGKLYVYGRSTSAVFGARVKITQEKQRENIDKWQAKKLLDEIIKYV